MNSIHDRILRFKGTPYEIGFAAGRILGGKIEETINHYIASLENSTDLEKLHTGALPWLRGLPRRFQEEYEGLAEGANLSLQRLAKWSYIEECETKQCSAAVYLSENRAWVARNNDTYAVNFPADLIHILADDHVERRESKLVTAYANVACTNTGEIWYTFGGYPAASKGNWQQLEWPWAA